MKFIAAFALAVAAFAAVRAQEIAGDCVIACADGAQEKSDCRQNRQKYVPPLALALALALPLLCPVNPLIVHARLPPLC